MKVAIVLYSGTGNTRSVVERLSEKLRARGHEVDLREITVDGKPTPPADEFTLASVPAWGDADALVLASPVMAFSLSPVMKAYLRQVTEPPAGPVHLVVTEHLPLAWMGGRQAVRWLRRELGKRHASVGEAMIVNWSNRKRNEQIERGTDRIAAVV